MSKTVKKTVTSLAKPPCYNTLRSAIASVEQLALFNAKDTRDIVNKINEYLVALRLPPISQSDYPTSSKKLERLIARAEKLKNSKWALAKSDEQSHT